MQNTNSQIDPVDITKIGNLSHFSFLNEHQPVVNKAGTAMIGNLFHLPFSNGALPVVTNPGLFKPGNLQRVEISLGSGNAILQVPENVQIDDEPDSQAVLGRVKAFETFTALENHLRVAVGANTRKGSYSVSAELEVIDDKTQSNSHAYAVRTAHLGTHQLSLSNCYVDGALNPDHFEPGIVDSISKNVPAQCLDMGDDASIDAWIGFFQQGSHICTSVTLGATAVLSGSVERNRSVSLDQMTLALTGQYNALRFGGELSTEQETALNAVMDTGTARFEVRGKGGHKGLLTQITSLDQTDKYQAWEKSITAETMEPIHKGFVGIWELLPGSEGKRVEEAYNTLYTHFRRSHDLADGRSRRIRSGGEDMATRIGDNLLEIRAYHHPDGPRFAWQFQVADRGFLHVMNPASSHYLTGTKERGDIERLTLGRSHQLWSCVVLGEAGSDPQKDRWYIFNRTRNAGLSNNLSQTFFLTKPGIFGKSYRLPFH